MQTIVGESLHCAVVDASHGFCRDHGVDDGFFDRLDSGFEEWVHVTVGHHRHLRWLLREAGAGIRRGKGDENVAGAVS